jgi:hypothetical protein
VNFSLARDISGIIFKKPRVWLQNSGPLLIPYRPGTPTSKLQAKAKKQGVRPPSVACPTAPSPAAPFERAPVPPRVMRL